MNYVDKNQTKLLMDISRYWGKIKYFHPNVVLKQVNWNQILIDNYVKIINAKSRDELRKILYSIQVELGDPMARSILDEPLVIKNSETKIVELDGQILLVQISDTEDIFDSNLGIEYIKQVTDKIQKSKGLILDLRNYSKKDKSAGQLLGKKVFGTCLLRRKLYFPQS